MREILFRGRRKDNGEWVNGFLWTYAAIGCISAVGDIEEIAVDPATIGEYTGLADKNGVKIFENDILCDTRGETSKIYSVIWADGAFMIRSKGGYHFSLNALNAGEFEVIGNVHDDAQLLGGTA